MRERNRGGEDKGGTWQGVEQTTPHHAVVSVCVVQSTILLRSFSRGPQARR